MSPDVTPERDFQTVAEAFLEERARHGDGVLQRYIQMYPEYEEDLWLLVSEVAASEGDIPPPATPPSTLLHMLREDAQAAFAGVQEAEITSLLARAREHAGLDAATLAKKMDVTRDILAPLEERTLIPESIFTSAVTVLAQLLGTTPAAVRRYLERPPDTSGVAFHAPQGFDTARRWTFAELIENSPLMLPEQKARWRARASDGDLVPTDNA